jgi:hypothetical protein
VRKLTDHDIEDGTPQFQAGTFEGNRAVQHAAFSPNGDFVAYVLSFNLAISPMRLNAEPEVILPPMVSSVINPTN